MDIFTILMKFLESIPTNAAMVLMFGFAALYIKKQEKQNQTHSELHEKTEKRLEEGDERFNNIDDHFVQVHQELKSLHKMILKDIIYNDAMDLMERQAAYEEYVGLGGNGFIKKYYEEKLEPKIEEYIKEGKVR